MSLYVLLITCICLAGMQCIAYLPAPDDQLVCKQGLAKIYVQRVLCLSMSNQADFARGKFSQCLAPYLSLPAILCNLK